MHSLKKSSAQQFLFLVLACVYQLQDNSKACLTEHLPDSLCTTLFCGLHHGVFQHKE